MKNSFLKLTSVILFTTLVTISCKKKDTAPDETPKSITNNSSNVYGSMQSGYTYSDYGNGMIMQDSNIIVSFYRDPQSTTLPVQISGGTVTVNGSPLNYTPPQNNYFNSQPTTMNSLSFSATGAGTVAAFNYSYTAVYPSYTGSITIADTITKANGISFTINGITNTNIPSIRVYIFQNSASVIKSFNLLGQTIWTIPITSRIISCRQDLLR